MNHEFTVELLRRMRPKMQQSYAAHCSVPLEIKLRLERLRLMEIIRSRHAPQRLTRPVGEATVPAYAMT